ncbi:MAG: hypothetical protein RBU30_14850 [Polyangia bacterium]|jgi:hypothetical protein|nr:hypothetical protein [Polyangia bacterium]
MTTTPLEIVLLRQRFHSLDQNPNARPEERSEAARRLLAAEVKWFESMWPTWHRPEDRPVKKGTWRGPSCP